MSHPYVSRIWQSFQEKYPNYIIAEWNWKVPALAQMAKVEILNVHWLDHLYRNRPWSWSASRSLALILRLGAVRICGTRIVWTIHNPIGKGHSKIRLEKLVRYLLLFICHRVVFINQDAVEVEILSLGRSFSRTLRKKSHVVPLPLRLHDHGSTQEMKEAQRSLGIATEKYLVGYFPGNGQEDQQFMNLNEIVPLHDEYQILFLERVPLRVLEGEGKVTREVYGWRYCGHPDDLEYGRLLDAVDVMVFPDQNSYGSMTIHTCVEFRKKIIACKSPAAEEAIRLELAEGVVGNLTSSTLVALLPVVKFPDERLVSEYFENHSESLIRQRMGTLKAKSKWQDNVSDLGDGKR